VFFVNFANAQKKKKDNVSSESRMTLDRLFVDAHREKNTGSAEKAINIFKQCLSIDKHHAASMYEIAKLLRNQNKNDQALEYASNAYEEDNTNEWYAMEYAELLQLNNKAKSAIEVYETLVKQKPGDINYYFMLVESYMQNNDNEAALKVFDKIEKRFGVDADIVKEKQRIYIKMGKLDKAAEELEKLIASDPSLENYGLLVELYQINNEEDKAYEVIQRMKKIDADDPRIALSLAQHYRVKGEKEKSYAELKKAMASKKLPAETKYKIMLSYLPLMNVDEGMKAQAKELSKIFVDTEEDDPMAHAIYADILIQDKNYNEARIHLRASLKKDTKTFATWQQLMNCDLQLADWVELDKTSNQAMELFPTQPVVFLYNGIANSQLKSYETAIKSLMAGSKMVVLGDPLLLDFYSSLGDNYYNVKNYPESDKYYEKVLKLDPKNSSVLNNWAYYLSLRKENLDKAAEMAKKVTELNPHVATYEDTYAWVLYAQGKYAEAKTILESALQNGGDKNGAILEHYGDVLFKLNNPQKALEYWQKAEQAGDASELIKQKIYEKKLFD
jgi:tetratricopeptide (TPR) repeat protein